MSKNIFPIYSTVHLSKVIFVTLNDASAVLEDVSLEFCTLSSGKKFIDDENVSFNLIFGKTELDLKGNILNFKYIREEKKYHYNINLKFDDLILFKKWFAIIKGLHKARFSK